MKKITFVNNQQESGFNKYGHYQFGSNCCIGCKRDRPLNEKGEWCEVCKNYSNGSQD